MFDFPMQGFDSKLALDLLYESQTANRDCFRPAILSLPRMRDQVLPLPTGDVLLKIPRSCEAA
jgi:hypothetical protein